MGVSSEGPHAVRARTARWIQQEEPNVQQKVDKIENEGK